MKEKIEGAWEVLAWSIVAMVVACGLGAACGIKSQPLPPEPPGRSAEHSEPEPGDVESGAKQGASRQLEEERTPFEEEPDVFE